MITPMINKRLGVMDLKIDVEFVSACSENHIPDFSNFRGVLFPECGQRRFQCSHGDISSCLRVGKRCDKTKDCKNGRDEENCGKTFKVASSAN